MYNIAIKLGPDLKKFLKEKPENPSLVNIKIYTGLMEKNIPLMDALEDSSSVSPERKGLLMDNDYLLGIGEDYVEAAVIALNSIPDLSAKRV